MSFLSHMFCFHSFTSSFSTSYNLTYRCLALTSSGVSDGKRGLFHMWCALLWLWPFKLGECPPSLPLNCSAVWPWCFPFHFTPLLPHGNCLQHGWSLSLTVTHCHTRYSTIYPAVNIKHSFMIISQLTLLRLKVFILTDPPYFRNMFVISTNGCAKILIFFFPICFSFLYLLLCNLYWSSCRGFLPAHSTLLIFISTVITVLCPT